MDIGIQEFTRAWSNLQNFLAEEPIVVLQAEYMWKLFYLVRCSSSDPLSKDLMTETMKDRLPSETEEAITG